MLRVVEGGLSSTIQDAGRPGHGRLGVARGGAADQLAMGVANALVGNAVGTPVLEMTLLGGTFQVLADRWVAIGGADMEAHVLEEGRPLEVACSHHLAAGTTLRFGAAIDGARTYLAIAGGFAGQRVLGSAATDLTAGFGGLDGRALRAGDLLETAATTTRMPPRRWPAGTPASGIGAAPGPRLLGIVPGPHHGAVLEAAREALAATTWRVSGHSDRVGLRLEGTPGLDGVDLDLVSLPMLPGALQVPPSGQPIVLMPDAPTVGGYPVPAVLAEADRATAAQLRPGDELCLVWLDVHSARTRTARRAASFRAALASLERR